MIAAHPVNILKTTDLYTLKGWIVYKLYLKKKKIQTPNLVSKDLCLVLFIISLPSSSSYSFKFTFPSHQPPLLLDHTELATALGPGTSNLSLPGMLILLILNSWFYFHSECSLNSTFSLRPYLITHITYQSGHSLSHQPISIFWTAYPCMIYYIYVFAYLSSPLVLNFRRAGTIYMVHKCISRVWTLKQHLQIADIQRIFVEWIYVGCFYLL